MKGQILLEGFDPPRWIDCFKSCCHFREVPPDRFPLSNNERCQYYHIYPYGTSGKNFYFRNINGSSEMFCKLYEL